MCCRILVMGVYLVSSELDNGLSDRGRRFGGHQPSTSTSKSILERSTDNKTKISPPPRVPADSPISIPGNSKRHGPLAHTRRSLLERRSMYGRKVIGWDGKRR